MANLYKAVPKPKFAFVVTFILVPIVLLCQGLGSKEPSWTYH